MNGNASWARGPVILHKWGTPAFLLRAFTEEKFADMFVQKGKLRLRSLGYYRDIEDESRRDSSEGELHTVCDAGCYHHRYQANPKFVLCMSGPDIDTSYQAQHFGAYVVRIDDPAAFSMRLHRWLRRSRYRQMIGHIECLRVTYGPTEIDYSGAGVSLIYSNKSDNYKNEDEYRIVVMCNSFTGATEYLDVDLRGPLPFVRRVE